MYTEFVIIFVLLGVLALLMAVMAVLLAITLAKVSRLSKQGVRGNYSSAAHQMPGGEGIAFCKRCATRFDAGMRICPKCGTPR